VSGSVNGNIIAEAKVVLHKSAKVSGDIQTPAIVVEEGAIITGKINMSSTPSPKSVSSLKAVDTKTDAKEEASGTNG